MELKEKMDLSSYIVRPSLLVLFLFIIAFVSLGFLIIPLSIVIPSSFAKADILTFPIKGFTLNHYMDLISDQQWREPLLRSIFLALKVGILSTFVGLLSAYCTCYTYGKVRNCLIFLNFVPLFIPPVVLGLGQLLTFGPLGLVDTPFLVLLSHSLLGLPLAYMISLWGLLSEGIFYEQSAIQLGSNRWYSYFRVIIPSMRTPILASCILCALLSFDESVIVLFIVDWKARTLPREMFDSLRYDLSPVVAAAAVLTMVSWMLIGIFLTRKKNLI